MVDIAGKVIFFKITKLLKFERMSFAKLDFLAYISVLLVIASFLPANAYALAPTGSYSVTIEPAAVSTAAYWRIDGRSWQRSGATINGLGVGSHTIDFWSVSGWQAPDRMSVSVGANQTTTSTATYTLNTGFVSVTIAPAILVMAGAKWRVDGGAWQYPGAVAGGLAPGSHAIDFSPVSGWTTPASMSGNLSAASTTVLAATYTRPAGSYSLAIQPADAVAAGAQWRIAGGAWQSSGATVSGLVVGNYPIQFLPVPGWMAPASTSGNVDANLTTNATASYSLAGSYTLTIEPATAASAGAQWRIGGGAWQSSGATVSGLIVGSYPIDFSPVPGWIAPGSTNGNISANLTTSSTATYTRPTGAYSLTIQPAGAVAAGAQWRIGGGAWQNSGATVSGLLAGSYPIDFAPVPGWIAPLAASGNISANLTTSSTATYSMAAQLAGLTVFGNSSINEGASLPSPLTATANYSDGSSKVLGTGVAWQSSNTSVAAVDALGYVTTGKVSANTPVTITATYNEQGITRTASKTINVIEVPTNASIEAASYKFYGDSPFSVMQSGVIDSNKTMPLPGSAKTLQLTFRALNNGVPAGNRVIDYSVEDWLAKKSIQSTATADANGYFTLTSSIDPASIGKLVVNSYSMRIADARIDMVMAYDGNPASTAYVGQPMILSGPTLLTAAENEALLTKLNSSLTSGAIACPSRYAPEVDCLIAEGVLPPDFHQRLALQLTERLRASGQPASLLVATNAGTTLGPTHYAMAGPSCFAGVVASGTTRGTTLVACVPLLYLMPDSDVLIPAIDKLQAGGKLSQEQAGPMRAAADVGAVFIDGAASAAGGAVAAAELLYDTHVASLNLTDSEIQSAALAQVGVSGVVVIPHQTGLSRDPTGLTAAVARFVIRVPEDNPADCVFNWAARTYPSNFPSGSVTSGTSGSYRYNYYEWTDSYLAHSLADDRLVYKGPLSATPDQALDLGPMPTWARQAGCN